MILKKKEILFLYVIKTLIQNLNRQKRQQEPSDFLSTKSTETQTNVQETLEFILTKARGSFSFGIALQLKNGERMLRLGSLKLYTSILKENEYKKFELNESIGKK